MSIFSKTCEYAIRAVFFIAQRSEDGERVGIREIAAGIDSPELYLGKILQDLSRKGLISSAKGPHGGFYIDPVALNMPLIEIVKAVDGDGLFYGCGLGLKACSAKNPCPFHDGFKEIRKQLLVLLSRTTIGEFNKELYDGVFSLKR